MDGFWAALGGGLVPLTVGYVLLQAELGGRRRRRRRDIREELALLTDLGSEHAQVASRIRDRLAVKLEQYEPPPSVVQARRDWWLSRSLLVVLALGFGFLVSSVGFTWWLFLPGAVVTGTVPLIVESRLERIREKREQDEAVAKGSAAGSWGFTGKATGVRPPDPEGTSTT